jgi:uncharacterized protein
MLGRAVMNVSTELLVFLIGTFAAAFVTGVSGFAFGLVAAAIWLYAITPLQIAFLIVANALLVQGYAVFKLRQSIVASRLWPFIVGSAIGIPLGILALKWVPATQMKFGIAVLLILFSAYNLIRPQMPNVAWTGRWGDGSIGVLNGALGGATGLAGILVVIWASMRGWAANEQRAVFQPTAVATFAMSVTAFGAMGVVSGDTLILFALGLPALLLGTLAGWAVYKRLDEARFRRVVLWLLLASGVAIIVSNR